ncbi:MAG: hypothetical protein HYX72_00210 [Acidobacteria bacterium]|nr:hypothetical protein [Acidobacteriota bacterium]
MALLETMEQARQRMLKARRQLDDYDQSEGKSGWDVSEHSRLSDQLIMATDEYIQLVAEFLRESSSHRKRHGANVAA